MKLERNEKLAEVVGIFLGAGDHDELLTNNIITITLDKDEVQYVKYVIKLLISIFKVELNIRSRNGKMMISIIDKDCVAAFKKDALELST